MLVQQLSDIIKYKRKAQQGGYVRVMNYQTLIEQNIGTVYQAGIATKILQHMDRIRNVSDVSQARRW